MVLECRAEGGNLKIVQMTLDPKTKDLVRSLGIDVGDDITILRRSPFGSLLHVRMNYGAEFAIEDITARSIIIECLSSTHSLVEKCAACAIAT